ncbi:hypothetical protein K474DRAFT_1676112 [Panus rudis PR-1116 ss-1]|nr:hypothetical protein K474DRAFT_1676112 [Panus rudis PR-1116 ss-1]
MAPTIGRFRMTAMLDNGPSSEPLIINLPSVESIPPSQLGKTTRWEADGEAQGTGMGTGGSTYIPRTGQSNPGEDRSTCGYFFEYSADFRRFLTASHVASTSRRMNEAKLANRVQQDDNEVKVSARLQHKMRAAEHVYWFESTGIKEIPHPPSIAADAGLQQYDLFLHKILGKDVQSWIYVSEDEKTGPPYRWIPIKQGASMKLPKWKRARYFVITKGAKPSFVSGSTVTKNYAALEDESAEEARAQGMATLRLARLTSY